MKRLLFLLSTALVASCSGHGNAMPPTEGSPVIEKMPIQPPVISASFIRDASRVQALNVVPRSPLPRFLTRGPSFGRLASVGQNDKELEGISVQPASGSPYTGIFAAQTVYTKQFLQLGIGLGGSGPSSLIAPLLTPPNKSCLTSGALYNNPGTGTTADFFVLDVCAGKIEYFTPIDTAFEQTYTRVGSRGVPQVITLVLTVDAIPTTSSVWYAFLYNYTTARYDLAASSTGVSTSANGQSVWLSEFAVGPCPVTPVIAADAMYLYNAVSKGFERIIQSMTQTTTAPFSSNATCFSANQGGPASFAFSLDRPNSSWSVKATPPTPIITEYANGITPGSQPEFITTGTDGTLWFTEFAGNRIGKLYPAPGLIAEYFNGISANANPMGITLGPDGNFWFTEAGGTLLQIGRITPTGTVTEFQVVPLGAKASRIIVGPDNNLWFTEPAFDSIARMTTSGSVTQLSVPDIGSQPTGIAAGPDGYLWFTEKNRDKIGRTTLDGSVVVTFSNGITSGANPYAITSGPDGNLWFTEQAGRIARITPAGVVTEFSSGITSGSVPTDITPGPDGNLWFTENVGNRIGRITTGGVITEFASGVTAKPFGITVGPDGNLWFAENIDRIGRLIL